MEVQITQNLQNNNNENNQSLTNYLKKIFKIVLLFIIKNIELMGGLSRIFYGIIVINSDSLIMKFLCYFLIASGIFDISKIFFIFFINRYFIHIILEILVILDNLENNEPNSKIYKGVGKFLVEVGLIRINQNDRNI